MLSSRLLSGHLCPCFPTQPPLWGQLRPRCRGETRQPLHCLLWHRLFAQPHHRDALQPCLAGWNLWSVGCGVWTLRSQMQVVGPCPPWTGPVAECSVPDALWRDGRRAGRNRCFGPAGIHPAHPNKRAHLPRYPLHVAASSDHTVFLANLSLVHTGPGHKPRGQKCNSSQPCRVAAHNEWHLEAPALHRMLENGRPRPVRAGYHQWGLGGPGHEIVPRVAPSPGRMATPVTACSAVGAADPFHS
mmetsp:Transcript_65796/g.129649  ORF Transcript_65796/g.129649 Transcript_65796/m.129649 type:complete len:244 (-) Transcript_65796:799-1530(-)